MLIEFLAQVLSPSIGLQDLNGLAVVLRGGPGLECFVGLKSLVLGAQQEGRRVPGRVVREGNEVPSVLTSGDGGWAPYIGMHFVSEILGWWTDPDFRYGQTGGMHEDAGITVCFLGAWVQFDPYDGPASDELACALDCDVPQA